MLQLSDFLLQTGGLLLIVVELLLEVTLPGLDQSQSLFQLEVDVVLVSTMDRRPQYSSDKSGLKLPRSFTLSVAYQEKCLVPNLRQE